ncbi:hypothetical protein [Lysobacter sp. F6437]|uniref:hypothetical protein n=1 Tax=Lysobacter sp. F6437 TaxID=3459296 RepID=UPI00403DBB9F
MKISTQFPFDLHWTAQDLADAVPLRLSEMVEFATTAGKQGENDSRFDRPPRRELGGRYLHGWTGLSLFRVHG